MKDNLTPEEKLLKLIRREKKQPLNIDKESVIKYPIPYFIQKYLSFLWIRRLILGIFAVSVVFLVISLIYPWIGLREIKLPALSQERLETGVEPKEEIKPYEFYLQGLNRQIFASASREERERPISSADTDLIKDINLVGIISGDNSQAIIEDKRAQKSYYLTRGEFMGEFCVEDIQKGKVVLDYKGQRFELYL